MAVTGRMVETEGIEPIWPDFGQIDFGQTRLSYDRKSDTLYGRERDAISLDLEDDRLILVDPNTREVVGFQIEAFLARVVHDFPPLLVALDVAELRGITPGEICAEHKALFSVWERLKVRATRRSAHDKKCMVMRRYADRSPQRKTPHAFAPS